MRIMKEKQRDAFDEFSSSEKSKKLGFYQKVYSVVESIPCGFVASYKTVATACGRPDCARQVGWALHVNPNPIKTPCHRVVFADGRLTGSFAFGGAEAQRGLLLAEGVLFDAEGRVSRDRFCSVADLKTFEG